MDLPKIKEGKILLLKAERKTGIILNNDNSYYLQMGNNFYKIFSSINEAKEHVQTNQDSTIEYIFYDFQGNCMGEF